MTEAVLVQNLAPVSQMSWVFIAIPHSDMPKGQRGRLVADNGDRFPWVRDGAGFGIRALVTLPANTLTKFAVLDSDEKQRPFVWHPTVEDNVMAIAPRFRLGDRLLPPPGLEIVHADEAVLVAHLRTHDAQTKVTVDCWVTVGSAMSSMDFVCQAVYGTTANDGQPQVADLPALHMESAARIHADFAVRNGHAAPQLVAGSWQSVVAPAGRWHRAVRYELRGALLAVPDETRQLGLPMQGLYSCWEGRWLALSQVPAPVPGLAAVRDQQRNDYMRPTPGVYSNPRTRTQPRESGTTGEQADFGCASDLAVTMLQPWEIHDALWQCQSYAQRPTANKEPDGRPMQAELHPQAMTYNQRPDLAYGPNDRLGWPGINQMLYIPSGATTLWTTSDDQHRADNFLHATYLLTRDYALGQLIQDHVELDRTDVYVLRRFTTAPRAIGRLALTRANQIFLGFDAESVAVQAIEDAIRLTPYGQLPIEAPVRTLGGRDQAKYGWNTAEGRPVIGWQGWQETIAAIGILAVARVTGRADLLEMAKRLSEVVTHNCWQVTTQGLRHAYAIAWNEGQPWPSEAWPASLNNAGDGWTSHIFVTGACDIWTIAAAHIIYDRDPNARAIIGMMPPPRSIAASRWVAL